MNILAIDASTKSSGWAIFEDARLLGYGCIQSASADLIKRIYVMKDGIEKILNEYKIDKIILEEVRPEQGLQNLKTHKALLYLQAAIAFVRNTYNIVVNDDVADAIGIGHAYVNTINNEINWE